VDWVRRRLPAHGAVFLTHGEDEERQALRAALTAIGLGGDQIVMPQIDDYFELGTRGITAAVAPATRRIDPAQLTSDWHNLFSDFTIRLSQRLHSLPDHEKLRLMTALQAELTSLGAPVSALLDVRETGPEPGAVDE